MAKQLNAQKSALATLQAQYTKLSAEQEKNKAKHDDLVADYEKEQQKLKVLEQTLGTSSAEYKAQAVVVANLAKDVDKSSQANARNEQTLSGMRTEMNGLKTSIATTESEISKADKATDELSDSTKEAGENAEKAGDGFTVFKGVLANLASSAIQGALNGLKNLGSAMISIGKQAVTSYADFEQLTGGVETLFGTSADAVMEYANNAYKTAGLSANEYMETVTSFSASLISSLGGDTAKASEYANKAITDMSDNANKMGSDMATIQNAYQGFAKQNYTMLDNLKLGYGGTKEEMQRLLEDAQAISGIEYDISSYADVVDAIHVIQTEMGITGTTAKEASETISGSLSMAQGAWSNLLTGIADDNADFDGLINDFVNSVLTVAKNLIPRIQTVIGGLGKMISGLLETLVPELIQMIPPLIEETLPILIEALQTTIESLLAVLPTIVDSISRLIPQIVSSIISMLPQLLNAGIQILMSLINGISTAIPQLLAMLPQLIMDIVNVISSNLPLIIQTGMQLLQSIIQGITETIPALVAMLPEIITTIVTTLLDNLPLILQTGIQLLDGIINGLNTAIPQLISYLPTIIDTLINTLLGMLPQIIQMAMQFIVAIINGLTQAIPQLVSYLPQIIVTIVSTLLKNLPQILKLGVEILWELIKGIGSVIGSLATTAGTIFTTIWNAIKDLPSTLLGLGKDLIKGLWNGISDMTGWIKDKIKGLGDTITNAIKSVFGIASPSKVFRDQVGKNLALGIGEGFSDEMKEVTSEMQDAIPTSFDTDASLTASGLPQSSLSTTGGYATSALVEAFRTAMQGMEIEMGEDGFAQFVVKTISREIYQ